MGSNTKSLANLREAIAIKSILHMYIHVTVESREYDVRRTLWLLLVFVDLVDDVVEEFERVLTLLVDGASRLKLILQLHQTPGALILPDLQRETQSYINISFSTTPPPPRPTRHPARLILPNLQRETQSYIIHHSLHPPPPAPLDARRAHPSWPIEGDNITSHDMYFLHLETQAYITQKSLPRHSFTPIPPS